MTSDVSRSRSDKEPLGKGMDESQRYAEHNSYGFQDRLSKSEVASFYSSYATYYEKANHLEGLYLGPSYVAKTLSNICGKINDPVVLDVACGTGIVGEQLYKAGFRKIDGLDPSPGMLDICRDKGIYTKLICAFMTETPSDICSDTYDCMVCCGGFGPGHIPRGALREMIRIVKPGGYICVALRQEYLDTAEEYNNNKLDDTMCDLESSGLWKKIERRILSDYFYNKPGVLFLYQIL